jgi:M-phase inducer tyrosine phosphatase
MNKIMNGSFSRQFDTLKVIDCRFQYEYDGGHIHGSVNINDAEQLDPLFFVNVTRRTLLVFHCEFSQVRGPDLAELFRKIDRQMNEACYPKLHYPFVYVLHGGYSAFHDAFPEHCEGTYTKMFISSARDNGELASAASQFKQSLERAKAALRQKKHPNNENSVQFDSMSPKKLRCRRLTCA